MVKGQTKAEKQRGDWGSIIGGKIEKIRFNALE